MRRPGEGGGGKENRALPPAVLVAGGLDPTGGAGLTLDLGVLRSLGLWGLPVAACLTVQDFREFRRALPVEEGLLEECLRAALGAAPVGAVKVGLLGAPSQASLLARLLPEGIPLVVDPVLGPTLGQGKGDPGAARALREAFLPLGPVLTPNLPELYALAGLPLQEDPARAARILLEGGASGVALKGGHEKGKRQDKVADRLFLPGGEVKSFERERDSLGEVHGTGCAFSSALAGYLVLGKDLPQAVRLAGAMTARLRLSSRPTGGKSRLIFP